MLEWISRFRNNYRERYRVGYKRAVILLWLEISFGVLMLVLVLVMVKIFLG